MDAGETLTVFSGIAMQYGWKSYDAYTDCRHVLCNAHLLRDLQGIIDSTGEKWAQQMQAFLNTSLNAEKAIQRTSAKSGARESVYCLSIHIKRKTGTFFGTKKERKTDAFSKFMESLLQIF